MRLVAIGADSSHLPEFSRRINALNDAGQTRCRMTRFLALPDPDWPVRADVEKWIAQARELGLEPALSMDDALAQADGVLVLAVNGHRHLELAMPAIRAGLPTYIDKPLTCSLDQARQLLDETRRLGTRCYSASSLRFITELERFDFEAVGEIVAIDAWGAGELLPMMPHLWHYGCHSVEMVDAIFARSGQGAGVSRVRAIATPDRHLVDYEYRDGRCVRLRLERAGAWGFGATVHGKKGARSFTVDFAPVYTRLVERMIGFFEGKPAPVDLRDIVETIAVLECGNRSIEANGAWIEVPAIA